MKKIIFDIDIELAKKVKIYCAENEISIKDFITKLILDFFKKAEKK
jgi:hypothetical protein